MYRGVHNCFACCIMDLSMLCVVLMFCARGFSASSFARVLRVSLAEYNDNIHTTHQNKTVHVDCARACGTGCLSFTYDPETKECRTFTKIFCNDVTAPKSTELMMFAKLNKELPNNPADCDEVNQTIYCSGIYRISPTPGVSFDVYCDMDTADGPWTVIQNRQDGGVNFYRSWDDYKNGFGHLKGNFWLGNEAIHHLTVPDSILRIELVSWLGDAIHAEYSTFRVGDETDNYRLTISGFSGNTLDNMALHDGMAFTTFDRDNDLWDSNCATNCMGGWWYRSCYNANLNGAEHTDEERNVKQIVWKNVYIGRVYTAMRRTRMLVKRVTP